MSRSPLRFVFCLCVMALPATHATPPDCAAPDSWAERTVCATDSLRALDEQAQALYRQVLAHHRDPGAI